MLVTWPGNPVNDYLKLSAQFLQGARTQVKSDLSGSQRLMPGCSLFVSQLLCLPVAAIPPFLIQFKNSDITYSLIVFGGQQIVVLSFLKEKLLKDRFS